MVAVGLAALSVAASSASAADRSLVDRPDDAPGAAQVHTIYALPADGADRELDVTGALAASMGTWQNWLRDRAVGRGLRIDTAGGAIDVSFVRLQRTDAELEATGPFVRNRIEEELWARGLIAANKLYAVYYDGRSNYSCGGGAYPPILPGQVGAVYLNGLPDATNPCRRPLSTPEEGPRYFEFAMLHELLHTLGFVPACAPRHYRAGHVPEPEDLMYGGQGGGEAGWRPTFLDVGRDDYFATGRTGCPDLATSPFREGNTDQDPDTTITSGPAGTSNSSAATFEFSSSAPGSTFECRLDAGAFAPCTSPKSYSGLSDGLHTFSVRATDAAGNFDLTPATRSFTVNPGSLTVTPGATGPRQGPPPPNGFQPPAMSRPPTSDQIRAALQADVVALARALRAIGLGKLVRRGRFTARDLDAMVPGGFSGKLIGTTRGTGIARKTVLAKGSVTASKEGRHILTLRLTGAGRRLLRRDRRSRVTLALEFRDAVGQRFSRRKTLSLRR